MEQERYPDNWGYFEGKIWLNPVHSSLAVIVVNSPLRFFKHFLVEQTMLTTHSLNWNIFFRKYKSALCEDLETQLAKVIEKNTELTMANSDLQKKVLELRDVSEECQSLKVNLARAESEAVTAKSEVNSLSGKVRNLESVLDEMHKVG